MTMITTSLSSDGDGMVLLWFASSNNILVYNTIFVPASSWKDIKEGVRVKLEFSIFDASASEEKEWLYRFSSLLAVGYIVLKNSKINVNKRSLFPLFRRIRSWKLLTTFDFRLAISFFADAPRPFYSSRFKEKFL